ncbi:C40 family peptidase [Halolamina rubra]|uniref:C40 family peptidase n=1 Tax=Halolamina rubra TaxID=1380430 RepID=UPI0006788306|nr:C40 family peptidase [Halolamina rubra]
MTATQRTVQLAVETFLARECPDRRTKMCDISVESVDGSIRLSGTVSTEEIATRLFDHLQEFPAVNQEASSLTELSEIEHKATVSATAASVLSAPDNDAEQVTKVLYGDEIAVYDGVDEWRRVRAPDGYLGWVASTAITPAESGQYEAVLRSNVARDAVNDQEVAREQLPPFVPIGTHCHVHTDPEEPGRVEFRTGVTATVPATAISRPDGLPTGGQIVDIARQFTGTPYEWGGMTTEGIDCSGLVWVSYRVFGLDLPRDADQQRLVGEAVARDELRPGDLLFFPGHVAISLGGSRYIHAHGDSGGVVESNLNPDEDGYLESLDEGLECCRRLIPA